MSSKFAVYRQIDASGRVLYIGASRNPAARYESHLTRSHWITEVVRIDIEWYPTRSAAFLAERAAILRERPPHNSEWKEKAPRIWPANEGHIFVRDWLRETGTPINVFASRLGKSKRYARELLSGVKHLRSLHARIVCVATDGFVPHWSWDRPNLFYRSAPVIRIPNPDSAKKNVAESLDLLRIWRGRQYFDLPIYVERLLGESAPPRAAA